MGVEPTDGFHRHRLATCSLTIRTPLLLKKANLFSIPLQVFRIIRIKYLAIFSLLFIRIKFVIPYFLCYLHQVVKIRLD